MSWRPIEYAPTDGTYILAAYLSARVPVVVHFATYHPNAPGKKEWRDESGHRQRVTHWVPIPGGRP